MNNKNKTILLAFFSLFLFSCEKEESDYFSEPDWLAPPLYEVLQNEGRFDSYLACVDRTLYAGRFKEGGFFTVMAPNNAAFAAYMQANNYASVDDIPLEDVKKIVAYSMLDSYWKSENLGDVFLGGQVDRYEIGAGVKKRTDHYATIYQDPDFDNKWVCDQNTSSGSVPLAGIDNNLKLLPVFMQTYFNSRNLSAYDYNVFFPNTEYVGGRTTETGVVGNVFDGQIIKPNMKARNGIAHEVSTVNYPLENMDKYLREDQYRVFKSLLDFKDLSGTYVYKAYTEYPILTEKYKLLNPDAGIDKVFVKAYNPTRLYFSPAYEGYMQAGTDVWFDYGIAGAEKYGNTLFVPSNEVLNDYIENRLLKYYESLHDLPLEAITTLINTHMADGMVWPSQLKTSQVSTGEYINGRGSAGASFDNFGVLGNQFTSNGFVYSIDHVIKSKLFETVYSEIFLNPKYSLLNTAYLLYYATSYRQELMKSVITAYPNNRYTVLLLPDDLLKEDGYSYNSVSNSFANGQVVSTTPDTRLKRLMRMHLFEGWVDNNVNAEVDFEDGNASLYGGWSFRVTHNGDVIRYKGGQLQAGGNIEEKTYVNITKGETFDNGTVYAIDKMLQYSKRETSVGSSEGWNNNLMWYYIEQTGTENKNVSEFADYVRHALRNDKNELAGISEENFYTIIMPTNNVLARARVNGDLPSLDSLKAGTLSLERIEICSNFLRAHFLAGRCLPDDRLPYLYPYNPASPDKDIVSTAYKINYEPLRLINQRTSITVKKEANGTLTLTPDDIRSESGKLLVKAEQIGLTTGTPTLQTAAPTAINGGGGNNGYRSNRIGGRAIHHEYNKYFRFTIQMD